MNSSTKKFLILLLFITIPIAGLTLLATNAQAYQFYSDDSGAVGDGTQNCAACHGEFRSGTYMPPSGDIAWNSHLHAGHLDNTTIGSSCDHCHGGAGTDRRGVNLSSSGVAADGVNALACTGCHVPEGLRLHHANNGVALCAGCHPNDPTPPTEDVAPPWYGSVTNLTTNTNLAPCNINGEEDFESGPVGLDNDGDNLYDTADPDCQLCGNGDLDPGEECDDGGANGSTTCGCQTDCTYTTAGTDCGDGEFCNGDETCDGAGACDAGTPVDCSDGVGCTDDACDEVNDICVNTANDANCPDDGLFCTGTEFCDAINDCSSTGDPCPAGFVCDDILDECREEAGCGNGQVEPLNNEECDDGANNGTTTCGCQIDCTWTPASTPCDDGLFCNEGETCDGAGSCQGGAPLDCSDGVSCTDDSCDEGNDQCVNTANDGNCDNGQFCDGLETCDPVSDCQAGIPVDCSDGVGCTDDACDEVNDACVNTANDANCPDDGLYCTGTESCDATLDCVSSGNPCQAGEICDDVTDTCDISTAPPPVNQTIGIDDGVFDNLETADCRFCHDGDDPDIEIEKRCDGTNEICTTDTDCSGGELCLDVTVKDRHHILALTAQSIPNPGSLIFYGQCTGTAATPCNSNSDCAGGETCQNQPVPFPRISPTDPDLDKDGVRDTNYGCNNCHPDNPATPLIEFTVTTECTLCHIVVGGEEGEGTVHHNTATANGDNSPIGDPNVGDCTPCHGDLVDDTGDGHVKPSYEPSLVTPRRSDGLGPDNAYLNGRGACNFCHDQDTVPPSEPAFIYSNGTTHHSTGFYNQGVCDWCHRTGDGGDPVDPYDIRTCENCHGYESLHNIAVNSDATGLVDTTGNGTPDTPNEDDLFVGAENPYYSHVGNNDDCLGCHGGYVPASAPGTGPITPYISGYDVRVITAGADKAVTLTGSAFTNYVGTNLFTSNVLMTGSDGSSITLTPDAIAEGSLTVTVPGTTAAGNYDLRVAKDNGTGTGGTVDSNPAVISVIPDVTIDSVACNKKKGMLTVTGTGFGDKPGGTDGDLNLQVDGQSVELISWADTQIRASVDRCSNRAAVTVNAVFGAATNGKPCKGKKCR